MKTKQELFFYFFMIPLLFIFYTTSTSFAASRWTVMVYLDADNNLESFAIEDFLEMATIGSDENVHYIVQMDRVDGEDTRYGNWKDCKRFRVTKNMTPDPGNAIESLGEVNMGDPDTLEAFINWSVAHYPAQNYALIMWDHGNGWFRRKRSPVSPIFKGVCFDDTNNSDGLYMYEVKAVLSGLAIKPNLVGFDACLMGMMENAYLLKNSGISVMVGSEELEPGDGWPYHTIAQGLSSHSEWSAAQLGEWIVDKYYESYNMNETQAAIDLTKIDALASALSSFATAMKTSWQDNVEHIKNAAQTVRNRIQDAVINTKNGENYRHASGLSIYFPLGYYDSGYDEIDLANDTTWNEFLSDYLNKMSGSWIALARKQSLEFENDNIDLDHFCSIIQTMDSGDQRPGYTSEIAEYNFVDIQPSGTLKHIQDDSFVYISPQNFVFSYYGEQYSSVSISDNGVIYFKNSDLSSASNESIPGSEKFDERFIAPFWDDMKGADIYWEVKTNGLEKRFIIQWHEVVHYSSTASDTATFQAILYEDGRIGFQYKDTLFNNVSIDHGNSATVGVQGSRFSGLQYSYDSPVIMNLSALLFLPDNDQGCRYSLASYLQNVGAQGEQKTLGVTTTDDCEWSVSSQESWINITSEKSGTGSGLIKYWVAENTQFQVRTGYLNVENKTLKIVQASSCNYELSPLQSTITDAGGLGQVSVISSNSGCTWEAKTNDSWIKIISENHGTTNNSVQYEVDKNTSFNKRTGTITIAGIVFTIVQNAAIAPEATLLENNAVVKNISLDLGGQLYFKINIPAAIFSFDIMTTGASGDCDVYIKKGEMPSKDNHDYSATVLSSNEKISISNPENGEWYILLFAYSTFNNVTLKVNYSSQNCEYLLSPSNMEISSSGGSGYFEVNTNNDCFWEVTSLSAWIELSENTSMHGGNGIVSFNIAENNAFSSRTGFIEVMNQKFEITQQRNETIPIIPLINTVTQWELSGNESSYAYYKITVPENQEVFIIKTWGGIGDCDMYIKFNDIPTDDSYDSASSNSSSDETIRISTPQAGDYFILLYGYDAYSGISLQAQYQASTCTYSVSETEIFVDNTGGTGTIDVTTQSACSWSAIVNVDWISIQADSASVGSGSIHYSVENNTNNEERSGIIDMSGQLIFINQAGATLAIPMINNLPITGITLAKGEIAYFVIDVPPGQKNLIVDTWNGTGDIDLYAKYGAFPTDSSYDYQCYAWGNDEYIYIKNPEAGPWYFFILGFEASSDVSMKGTYHTLDCNYKVSPMDAIFGVSGGTGILNVEVNDGCVWTAVKHGTWMNILEDTRRGMGNGSMTYTVPENENHSIRTHNIHIADQWITVMQSGIEETSPSNMINNVNIVVDGEKESVQYYMIDIPPNQENLSFNLSGGMGDCDFYISHESYPTFRRYDFRPYVSGNNEHVSIATPEAGIWYVMLYAYTDYSKTTFSIHYQEPVNLSDLIAILQVLMGIQPDLSNISFEDVHPGGIISIEDAIRLLQILAFE